MWKSKVDNLTAQLLGAEEMLEDKEADLRKSLENNKTMASELETVPLLKQQVSITFGKLIFYTYSGLKRAFVPWLNEVFFYLLKI